MFFSQLVQLCEERGEKVTAVVRKLRFSTGSMSQWKNGSSPTGDTLLKIAKYFGVSVDYLLTGKENKNSRPQLKLVENPKEEVKMGKRYIGRKVAMEALECCMESLLYFESLEEYEYKQYCYDKEDKEIMDFLQETGFSFEDLDRFVRVMNKEGGDEDIPTAEEFGIIRLATGKFAETETFYEMLVFEEENYLSKQQTASKPEAQAQQELTEVEKLRAELAETKAKLEISEAKELSEITDDTVLEE